MTTKLKLAVLSVALLIASVLRAEPFVPRELDHLVPVDLTEHSKYRKILISKLCVTPFDCGRAMLLPPFDPESTTSVYGASRNGRQTYYVTEISAEANLWQRTDAIRYPQRANDVKVQRCDTEIPKRTALLVKKAWGVMLQSVKTVPKPRNEVEVDATRAEFSLERPNAAVLRGDLDFSHSFPGQKTKQLVDIWNRLHDYCKAAPDARAGIARDIEERATTLIRDCER